MRIVLLVVVLVFMTFGAIVTVNDIHAHQHVSGLDVLSIVILIIFGTGIVGALLHPPKR